MRHRAESSARSPSSLVKLLLVLGLGVLGIALVAPLVTLVPACVSVTPYSTPCISAVLVHLMLLQLLLAGTIGAWLGRAWGAALWAIAALALPAGVIATPLRLVVTAVALGLLIQHGWRLWRARRRSTAAALAGGTLLAALALVSALHVPEGTRLTIAVRDATRQHQTIELSTAKIESWELRLELAFTNADSRPMRLDLPREDTYVPLSPLLRVAARDVTGRRLRYVRARLCGNAYTWRRVESLTLAPGETVHRKVTLLNRFFRRGRDEPVIPATVRLSYDGAALEGEGWDHLRTFARRPPELRVRGGSGWTALRWPDRPTVRR